MTPAGAPRPRIGLPTKIAYGFGAVASNLKARTMSTFLLIFYNQVVGLPPAATSLVIMCTLVFDALFDPLVGQVSDNHRSRWGRRHPFMYAAVIPTASLYFLLWNPPSWSESAIIAYLLICLIALRFFDTLFELPSMALLPELTEDYDERTRLISIRQFFSVTAGLGMLTLAYQVFLKENPDGSGGVDSRDGYFAFSLVGAGLIFLSIIVSTLGTHAQIPWLRQPPAVTPSVKAMFRESFQALNNRSFLAMAVSGLLIAMVVGMKGALDIYWWLYLYGLEQSQIAIIVGVGMAGSISGAAVAPLAIGRLGKKPAAMWFIGIASFLSTGPMMLWLAGLLPPEGSSAIFVFLMADQFAISLIWSMVTVGTMALMADVVEDVEVKTGRRSEGLLFSAEQLFKKSVSGLGVMFAGLILALSAFPADAKRAAVPKDVLTTMASSYIVLAMTLYFGAVIALAFFTIDREKHAANLAVLRDLKATATRK